MLTFNVILGYQGLLFQDFLSFRFFFSIRPTDPISGNAFETIVIKNNAIFPARVLNVDIV